MQYIVTAAQVRSYLELNSPGSTSRYSDETIGSNIRAAQSFLEAKCHRFFFNRTAHVWATTTMLQAQVRIPGFRSFSSVTWGGAALTVGLPGNDANASCWAIPESHEGVEYPLYTALQFRPWRTDGSGPWWLSDSGWFDRNLDSPWYPGNQGGGYSFTSMPNDLVIVGDAGYAQGTEPEALMHAIKVLASFYTQRPASIMSDVSITPAFGSLPFTQLPAEVVEFIADWKSGQQVVSV